MYTVDVTVPNGWVNLDVEFEGGENFRAANLRVVSSKCSIEIEYIFLYPRHLPIADSIGLYRLFSTIGYRYRPLIVFQTFGLYL